jgi:hypothetical protein
LSDHLLNTVFRKKTARRVPAAPAER